MTNLFAAAVFFVLLHLLVSGTTLRARLVGIMGEGTYMGLFSLASVLGLAWLGFGFAQARGQAADLEWWGATPPIKWAVIVIELVALLFIVPGLTTPNPTSVKQEGAIDRPDVVRGMLRITRHPFLWGVVVWAFGHLLANGDLASVILFASLLLLGLFGTASIDHKRKRALGSAWEGFAAQTSNVPFGAIASGRQGLRVGEIGWWRIALAVVIWAGLIWAHPLLFGVSPLP